MKMLVKVSFLERCNHVPAMIRFEFQDGADIENAGRWMRETSQKHVDNMELRRIRSSVDTQNRLMLRGDQLADTLR